MPAYPICAILTAGIDGGLRCRALWGRQRGTAMPSGLSKWIAFQVAVALLAIAPEVAAVERQWGRIDSMHLDQDLWAPGNEDRNYTMGVRFVWSDGDARHQTLNGFGLLHRIDGALGFDYDLSGKDTHHAVALGNSAFTPDDLRSVEAIFDDRPYASLLYTSSSIVVKDSDNRARGSKLVVGVLGLPISEWVQTKIHVVNRSVTGKETPYDPQGWHNQISDGGEPTAMYQRSWFRQIPSTSQHADAAGSCDLSIGYYTGASCGIVGKWGSFIDTDAFWSMLSDINPQSDADRFRSLASHGDGWIRELYVLAGVRAHAVGYNELLQGGFRHSEFELGSGDIERVFYEASVGVNLTFSSTRRFMFTCTRRSPEHKLGQRRAHNWCGLNFFSRVLE